MKLNVGCGRDVRPGYINIDRTATPGIDIAVDLNELDKTKLPIDDNVVTEVLMSHVIEHIGNVLPLMDELYRVAVPGALCHINCPYGSSDDADEDPTHVRRMFPGSFGYFSQPYYWKADYGYRGDWQVTQVDLVLSHTVPESLSRDEAITYVRSFRNVVSEMRATLTAVKPCRERDRINQEPYSLTFVQHLPGGATRRF